MRAEPRVPPVYLELQAARRRRWAGQAWGRLMGTPRLRWADLTYGNVAGGDAPPLGGHTFSFRPVKTIATGEAGDDVDRPR
jgi:hypothetical protein